MFKLDIKVTDYGVHLQSVELDDRFIDLEIMDFFNFRDNCPIEGMYSHMNKYLQTIPRGDQERLFDILYREYQKNETNNYGDYQNVISLTESVKEYVSVLNYQRWLAFFRQNNSDILLPEGLSDIFEHDIDLGVTAEKTYITSEYLDLIGMILFIRACTPLILEYYIYSKEVSKHPYYLLYMLFQDSELDAPDGQLRKLEVYIETNLETLFGTSKNEHLIISAGLSDDDVLYYLIAEVIFNKLLTIEFTCRKCNAVSYVFQTIRYKGNFETSESRNIKSKSKSGRDGSMEDFSYFEDYRKTTSMAIGTVTEIQESLSDIRELAMNLGYTNFNFQMYESELQYLPKLLSVPPSNIQIYLLGWFLGRTVNPRALFHIESRKVRELMLFAKVALYETPQAFIGIFLSSIKAPDGQFVNVMFKNNLSKELVDRLEPDFKFVMDNNGRSVIEETISEVGKEITNHVWIPVGEVNPSFQLVNKEGVLEIPTNINDLVCSYVDYILK